MPAKRKVRCIETGVIYNSTAEAAKAIGYKKGTTISHCCSGYKGHKTAGGYHWEYYEELDLPGEIWKYARHLKHKTDIIEDFDNEYEISNKGRIRYSNNKVIFNGYIYDEYKRVYLKGNNYYLHRIVATTFLPNDDPLNKIEVNHVNENEKLNNCVENLEWCTSEYNVNYGTRTERASRSNMKKVRCITTNEIFDSITDAADKYDVPGQCITACCKGNAMTSGQLQDRTRLAWEYYDEDSE